MDIYELLFFRYHMEYSRYSLYADNVRVVLPHVYVVCDHVPLFLARSRSCCIERFIFFLCIVLLSQVACFV